MGSTSVHIPDDLLRRLDATAKRRRTNRNRLIVEACRSIVGEGRGEWPEGTFAPDRLSPRDLRLLRSNLRRWLRALSSARRSKDSPPF